MSIPSPAQTNGPINKATALPTAPLARAIDTPAPGAERIASIAAPPTFETERIRDKLVNIQFDLHNAHKHSDEAIKALAASIAAIGLINDPLVYRDPDTGRLTLIAGEGRVRAMILLGWESTYVRYLKGTFSEQQRADLALVDNLLKDESLNDPLMFGLACIENMARTGRSARELAKVLPNKSASTICRSIGRIQKLPLDLHPLIRQGDLSADAANALTSLPDDDAKRHFARLAVEGKFPNAAALASAVRNFKHGGNGHAAAGPSGFTCEESGVKIAVTWTSDASDAQALANVENALRVVLKDLAGQKHRGLTHWKTFLEKKAKAVKKAAEAAAAQNVLAGLANPTPAAPPPAAK